MKTGDVLIFLFSVVFVTIGTIVIGFGLQQRDIEIRTMKGELISFEVEISKPFAVWLGGTCSMTMTLDELSTGINLRRFIDLGSDYPIQINFINSRLLVSADIKNANNVTIAKIVDNQWVVHQDIMLVRDRNYNSYAFEVIDSDLIPILQINLTSQNRIYIGGYFYFGSNRMFITREGIWINPSAENITDSISTIFKYPSEEHLGEMVNANYISNFLSLRSTQTIAIGGILFALGSGFPIYAGMKKEIKRRRKEKKKKVATASRARKTIKKGKK